MLPLCDTLSLRSRGASDTGLRRNRYASGGSLANLGEGAAVIRKPTAHHPGMTPQQPSLKTVLSEIAKADDRSSLFWWLVEHHDEIVAAANGRRMRWRRRCENIGEGSGAVINATLQPSAGGCRCHTPGPSRQSPGRRQPGRPPPSCICARCWRCPIFRRMCWRPCGGGCAAERQRRTCGCSRTRIFSRCCSSPPLPAARRHPAGKNPRTPIPLREAASGKQDQQDQWLKVWQK